MWTPSHVDIKFNEFVDKLAGDVVKDRAIPMPAFKSFSFACQMILRDAKAHWAHAYGDPAHILWAPVWGVPDPLIKARLSAYLG